MRKPCGKKVIKNPQPSSAGALSILGAFSFMKKRIAHFEIRIYDLSTTSLLATAAALYLYTCNALDSWNLNEKK